MKSILKYPGAKWRVADWILGFLPDHKVYLEPFFGSGAVFFKKQPAYIETINDIDGNIVNLFRVCREHPEELATAVGLTPFSREEFIDCYDLSVADPVERARRTLVRYHQSYCGDNHSKNSWQCTQIYTGPRCAARWKCLPETILSLCERLKNAQIENREAVLLIERYNDKDTLIYCDPPYLQSLRERNMYAHEMTDDDHARLLEVLKRSKSKIILSGYDNDLYNTILAGWNTAEKETTAQMGLHRVEKIWFNYDAQMKIGEDYVPD